MTVRLAPCPSCPVPSGIRTRAQWKCHKRSRARRRGMQPCIEGNVRQLCRVPDEGLAWMLSGHCMRANHKATLVRCTELWGSSLPGLDIASVRGRPRQFIFGVHPFCLMIALRGLGEDKEILGAVRRCGSVTLCQCLAIQDVSHVAAIDEHSLISIQH
ncbi:hypothetical protein EJ03DRAFT_219705 [Teratosphaeria nubilosa]|uniref:Uncharacterized protein n=1 Tax=Teratosphaeria nubilosa TaxID=161662 RepID=A0A6G1KWV4_9PEZI|nr:hypothetical protein EJ03DRAFT_219705 [Teratosphaeria nubilosa]